MIIKYIGVKTYIDSANRFELKKGDLLDINEEEAKKLLKLKDFNEVKEE